MITANQPLTFCTIRSAEEFALLHEEWRALFDRSGCSTASLSRAAVHAMLQHGGSPGTVPVVVVAIEHGRVVGGVPLLCRGIGRRLRVGTFTDTQVYGVDCLVEVGRPQVLEALLAHLVVAFGHTSSVVLEDIPFTSTTVACARALSRVAIHVDERRYASYLQVPSTEESLRSSVSSNFRKNLRKQETRLRSTAGVVFSFVRGSDATGAHFDRFLALESSGWKGQAGTAIALVERLRAFYQSLTEELARDGQLEWHFLEVNGRTIGGHLAVRAGSSLTLLKIAYDEEHAMLAPGNMLFLEMLRREIQSRECSIIDCLSDMPWHRNWRMDRKLHLTITLFPMRFGSLLGGYVPAVLVDSLRSNPLIRNFVRRLKRLPPLSSTDRDDE